MKYVKLGQTGLQVPAIVAGCMRLNRLDEMAAAKHIENAVAHGVNFFDHADIYGRGVCEEIFGKALAQTGIKREELEKAMATHSSGESHGQRSLVGCITWGC